MPGFAVDLGRGDPGVAYSVLLAADAAGALTAGIALEAWGRLRPNPRTAILLAVLWSLSLLAFASVGIYALAIVLLFAAGFFELSFNTMAQALVQLNAPTDIRGRVIGLYNMAGLGMRAFSGITVGVLGAAIGIHWSLGLSAAVLSAFLLVLHRRGEACSLCRNRTVAKPAIHRPVDLMQEALNGYRPGRDRLRSDHRRCAHSRDAAGARHRSEPRGLRMPYSCTIRRNFPIEITPWPAQGRNSRIVKQNSGEYGAASRPKASLESVGGTRRAQRRARSGRRQLPVRLEQLAGGSRHAGSDDPARARPDLARQLPSGWRPAFLSDERTALRRAAGAAG